MNSLIKYTNFLIFLFSAVLLFYLGSQTHISTSLLSVLPESQNREIIQKFETLHSTKTLMLAVKGFDEKSLKTMRQLEAKLEKINHIEPKKLTFNSALEAHQNRYRFYIQNIDAKKLSQLDTKSELSGLYESLTQSFIPISIDKYDPFALYIKQQRKPIKLHNNHLIIEGYGYLTYFDISSKNLAEHTEVQRHIDDTLAAYDPKEIRIFSPIFYYAENAQAIKTDVNHIILFAFSLLLILYVFILNNIHLLSNTLATLASSAIIAIIITTSLYPNVSIFVIVFGVSISTISIDYLFHHYLHGYYSTRKGFNREVLFGFLTTLGAFIIMSFTDFTLIKQISIFSIVSLTVAYLHFAFLYPVIGFRQQKTSGIRFATAPAQLSYRAIFALSSLIILVSPLWLTLDLNVKNLDYENISLQQKEKFFKTHLSEDEKVTVLIEADSIDQLIGRAKKVKSLSRQATIPLSGLVDTHSFEDHSNQLQKLSQLKEHLTREAANTGFREGYFSEAYLTDLKLPHYTIDDLTDYGISVLKIGSNYITYGSVDKKSSPSLSTLSFVKSLSLKTLFEASMQSSVEKLIKLGLLTLLFIFLMLLIITKKGVIRALAYLVFPLAVIVVYGFFTPLNILHIFMIFVVLSISIDYAIYTAKSIDSDTRKAITYSLMSTFAGFGVLIFSNINALFSMGIIATLGVVSLFFLLIFLKGFRDVS